MTLRSRLRSSGYCGHRAPRDLRTVRVGARWHVGSVLLVNVVESSGNIAPDRLLKRSKVRPIRCRRPSPIDCGSVPRSHVHLRSQQPLSSVMNKLIYPLLVFFLLPLPVQALD